MNHIQDLKFLEDRMIPRDAWNDIYFCSKFFEFTNRYVPNKFPSLNGDHPRMIIPFRQEDGTIFAYQGRAFGNEPQKYITIILDKECPKIFRNLDRVDTSRSIHVVEGFLLIVFLLRIVLQSLKVICEYLNTKLKRFLSQITNQETNNSVTNPKMDR